MIRQIVIFALAIELIACSVQPDQDPAATENAGRLASFDVIVVGAGAGGIAASIQAARMGRQVALLEPSSHIGGQLLTVTSMDESTYPDGPETREGIYSEFRKRVIEYYAPHPVGTCNFTTASTCYEARAGETILREMLFEAGVVVENRVEVAAVRWGRPHEIVGVTTTDGRAWTSRIVIDATEYGDILPLAQAAYRVGRVIINPGDQMPSDQNICVQESTYTLTIKKHDQLPPELDLVTGSSGPPGPNYDQRQTFWNSLNRPDPPNCEGGWGWQCHAAYRGTPDRDHPGNDPSDLLSRTKTMINALNDYPTIASLPDQGLPIEAIENRSVRRSHECAARMMTAQFLYFSQAVLHVSWGASDEMRPYGINNDHCDDFGPTLVGTERLFPVRPYIREARRLVGVRTLTGSDIERTTPSTFRPFDRMAHRSWATALSLGYYGTDMHGCFGAATLEADLGDSPNLVRGGGPFQIPFGAFIPSQIDGLLVAEKNLSMSRVVNSAVRVQPSSMMTGMAAGAIAAVAAARNVLARDVPPVLVQDALLSSLVPNNLSLFTYDDVPRTAPRWADVQFVSTLGILIGGGSFQFGVDQPLTRAQGAVALQRTFRYPIDPPSSVSYADVPTTHPMWRFIQAMTREGLTAGCGSTMTGQPLFCPDISALRQQLAVWTVAAIGLPHPACEVQPYPDVSTTDPYCPFIAAAKAAGIAAPPCAGGAFCPGAPISRGDAAAVARRATVYVASHDVVAGECHRRPPYYCDP